jgi:hypothetical protein
MIDLFSLNNLQNSAESSIEMTIEKTAENPVKTVKKVRFVKIAPKSSLKHQQTVVPQRFSIRIREKEELKKQKELLKLAAEAIEKEKKLKALKQKTEFENTMNTLSDLFYSKLLIKYN